MPSFHWGCKTLTQGFTANRPGADTPPPPQRAKGLKARELSLPLQLLKPSVGFLYSGCAVDQYGFVVNFQELSWPSVELGQAARGPPLCHSPPGTAKVLGSHCNHHVAPSVITSQASLGLLPSPRGKEGSCQALRPPALSIPPAPLPFPTSLRSATGLLFPPDPFSGPQEDGEQRVFRQVLSPAAHSPL